MKILSIDTSSLNCSTALLEDDNLIDENSLNNGKTHSENLMLLIEQLLNRNNLNLKDIDLISVSVGPGSFTGIRIGIASIKPMAEVYSIKVAGVTSLETLARIDETPRNKICLIDCKNNQVYFAVFDKDYNIIEDYKAEEINNLLEILKKYENSVAIGDGAKLYKDLLEANVKGIEILENTLQTAENTGKIGYKKFLNNVLETEFDEFWKPSILESELKSKNSRYIVAKKKGNILGFAGIIITPIDTEITNIVTKKSERKKGIGTSLLDRLIEMTKEAGKDSISLEVNETNKIAVNIYEKNGFEIVGRRKKYYEGKYDAIIMTKFFKR